MVQKTNYQRKKYNIHTSAEKLADNLNLFIAKTYYTR